MPDHHVETLIHIAEMLETLLSEGRVVLLSKAEGLYDASCSEGRHAVEVKRRGRKVSSAFSLEGAVEGLSDNCRTKVCLRPDCANAGRPQPLWCFGPDKDSADGHAGNCRPCEAKRVNRITKRKKQADGPTDTPDAPRESQ